MKKNVIGTQVGAISFVDEGVENVLDFLKNESGVNSIFISALSWARGNAGRATDGYPDHGPQEPDNLQGGAFFKTDPRYYQSTFLKEFEAPDPLYKGFDTLRDVIPEAKKRGIDTYIYYCETSRTDPKSRWVPGWPKILEVDHRGVRGGRPCYNNPEYKSWWLSVIEDYCNNHEGLEGLMWGLERRGPILAVLDGETPGCFCEYCIDKAHKKNIDAERARDGYKKLYEYVLACKNNEEMIDGYLATFMRIIMNYPEILQWEKMWYESHLALAKEVYGTGKWLAPKKFFGMGIWQYTDTFSFLLRAQYDYSDLIGCADFLKPILYHVPAGPRYKEYIAKRQRTIFKDFDNLGLLTEALYRVMGLKEGAYDELNKTGFSPEYIKTEVERISRGVKGSIPIITGIASGVPTGANNIQNSPQSVKDAVKASFDAGARGVVLSRNYSEANLDNMRACKEALKELGIEEE